MDKTADSPVDLANIDEQGNPPKDGRVKDAASARGIHVSLRQADEGSAINRRRVQAMFDGEPPFSKHAQRRTLQTQRANINFNEGKRWLDVATSGYVGLVNGVEELVTCYSTLGEQSQRMRSSNVIAQEFTRMVRAWPAFDHGFLSLAGHFIGHGVGVTYFEDEVDWRWKTCGLSDFLFPRQTPATESAIEVAFSKKEYLVHELFAKIADEEAAAEAGWNVPATKEAIRRASAENVSADDWEKLQSELKSNDLHCSTKSATIKVLHMWVREVTGEISHYILTETPLSNSYAGVEDGFLYKRIGRFSSTDRAFVLFSFGVGTHGTYHSVRGLGYAIFNQIQESNKLGCQLLDGARLSASILVQPENQTALDNFQLQYYGPYAVIGPNVRIIEKAIPNLSQSVVPALQDLRAQMARNMDFYSTDGVFNNPGGGDRSKYEVEAALEQSSRLSTTAMNLFYPSWSRLLREALRRACDPLYDESDGGWEEVAEFRRRCIERGVSEEEIFSLDHGRTKAVRAVGNGSVQSKAVALRNMRELMPMFDEVGRKNVVRDSAALDVGYDMVDRYAPQVEERPTHDHKIAELETLHLNEGQMIEASSIDLHQAHLDIHLKALLNLIEVVNTGQAEAREVLQGMLALFDHSNQHYDFVAADPAMASFTAQVRETLQQTGEIIHNTNKELEAEARKAALEGEGVESDPAPAPGGLTPEMDAKLQEHNLKLQMMQEKAQLEMNIKMMKAEQDARLKDAEIASRIRDKIR